jgi:hypothetical protein
MLDEGNLALTIKKENYHLLEILFDKTNLNLFIMLGLLFHECVNVNNEQVNMSGSFLEYFFDIDKIFKEYY